jgi:hypothetical protein
MSIAPEPTRETVLRTSQIITLALVGGVAIFLVIVLAFNRRPAFDAAAMGLDEKALVTLLALFYGLLAMVVSAFLPGLVVRNGLRQIASEVGPGITQQPAGPVHPQVEGRLLVLFQTTQIVTMAVLEGAVFFCLIAFFMEGKTLVLVLALILVGRMLAGFPTSGKLDVWLEQRRIELADIARSSV